MSASRPADDRAAEAAAALVESYRRPPSGGRWRRRAAAADRTFFQSTSEPVCFAMLRLWKSPGRFDAEALRRLMAEAPGAADPDGQNLVLVFVVHSGAVCTGVSNLNVRRGREPRTEVHARDALPLWEPVHPLRHVPAACSAQALQALGGPQAASLQEVLPTAPEVVFTGAMEGDLVIASEPSGPSFYVVIPEVSGLPTYERVLRRLQEGGKQQQRNRQLLSLRKAAERYAASVRGDANLTARLFNWAGGARDVQELAAAAPDLLQALTDQEGSPRLWPAQSGQAVALGARLLETPSPVFGGLGTSEAPMELRAWAEEAASADSDTDFDEDQDEDLGEKNWGASELAEAAPAFQEYQNQLDLHLGQNRVAPNLVEREYARRLWLRLDRQFVVPDQQQLEWLRRSAAGWLVAATHSEIGNFWRQLAEMPRALRLCMESEDAGELSLRVQVQALAEWLGEV